MPDTKEGLLEYGLAALAARLPAGYRIARSSLGKRSVGSEAWIVISGPNRRRVTCLVLARRRVEPRDLGAIAAAAAHTNNPALLVSTILPPLVRERLRGFGIGSWDLAGNATIELSGIGLSLKRTTVGSAGVAKRSRQARSLSGEMIGRVARALIDIRPPHAASSLAERAHVDASCVSRVAAFLTDAGIIERQPRVGIAKVNWQTLLGRWSLEAPLSSRGETSRFVFARGVSEFLSRLACSGFLHALTGQSAFARISGAPVRDPVTLYVDDAAGAVAQFGLHPAKEKANVILISPFDRSVFHRSSEKKGLRHVSPSLMVADLDDGDDPESVLRWLVAHESDWRHTTADPDPRPRRRRR
jgi:hypothetical protein